MYMYIMKCEWLKNESNYFVTCKYFRLILQPLQTVTDICNSLKRLQDQPKVLTSYKIIRLIL